MDQKVKNQVYVNAISRLQNWYTQFELARWFSLGESNTDSKRIARTSINRKLYPEGHPGKRGANVSDVLVAGLLDHLHDEGYDLSTLQFDATGKVIDLKKRPIKKGG
ncbi:hypothetical protein [Marinobacter salarius]|uniref:Uncharacterized protein n=1 Tax=Marinobacter salarius TaxID=1420917 RepID=A0A1W6KFD7_9GAMM|nr:hypothetical protein [Marinobacter salarius]ARM86113.1 hypothetical protein MARSALSMR5_04093 [Marinobacter salarius]